MFTDNPSAGAAPRGLLARAVASVLAAIAIAIVLGAGAVAPGRALAQVAAPGDVYYEFTISQVFDPGPFVGDEVTWANEQHAGLATAFTAAQDSVFTYGTSGVAADVAADGGALRADLSAQFHLDARTGMWHVLTNRLTCGIYVKGPTGTPYRLVTTTTGDFYVSRLGGAPGWAQPVNGKSDVTLGAAHAWIDSTGSRAVPVYDPEVYAGLSTTQVLVGGETYSLARTLTFTATSSVTQAYCVLGCMTAAASFAAECFGHVAVDVYLCDGATGLPCVEVPSDAGEMPVGPRLAVAAAPNPFNPRTGISFSAPAGRPVQVEVYDARGALVARLFDGVGTGRPQGVTWDARGIASGLYFARVASDGQVAQRKLMLLR